MMNFLRNPEVRRTLWAALLVSLLAAAGVWCLLGGRSALCVLAACALLNAVYLTATWLRYRRLACLAADIDRILHGQDPAVDFARYEEGELCILEAEVRKMTVRLRQQRTQLEADKVALSDAIADISHQIRTPLTSLNLMAQLLRKPDITPQRRQTLQRELAQMLGRIDWLITTLLKMSRLDAGVVRFQKETLPLQALLRRACEPLEVAMELREQRLELTAKGDFTGDAAWTAEAVGNIVKNCMEYTPAGGTVTVTGVDNPLYTQIQITDTGPGIPPEDLGRLFERFYKGEDSGDKGFGIGLALARMIVTGQNGTVKADNLPGGGARFTLRFFKSTV